jgi:hypothetical protein
MQEVEAQESASALPAAEEEDELNTSAERALAEIEEAVDKLEERFEARLREEFNAQFSQGDAQSPVEPEDAVSTWLEGSTLRPRQP